MTGRTAVSWILLPILLASSVASAQNAKPTSTFRLASAPEWSLDLRAAFPNEPLYIVGAVATRDGFVVAEGRTSRVLVYSSDKRLIRAIPIKSAAQSRATIRAIQRVIGDTVALLGDAEGWVFRPADSVASRISFLQPKADARPHPTMLLGVLANGSSIWGALDLYRQMNPPAKVFVDSLDLIVQSPEGETHAIKKVPALMLGTDSAGHSRQMWFYPHMAYASFGESFYYGFGTEYAISKLNPSTGAESSFKRAWTRRKVTDADVSEFIRGWGLNWNTGADSIAVKASMQRSPYHEFVPAFSQFVLSSSNELWVRTPNLIDAQAAGELNQMPLTSSAWSVFDENGKWLADVHLPAGFVPTDIGPDYVFGVQYVVNGSRIGRERSVVMYKYARAASGDDVE